MIRVGSSGGISQAGLDLILTEPQIRQRATNRQDVFLSNVKINHRRADIFVTEQLLNGADIVPSLNQMGGEGMAEGVG